ncbi:MAG TPA: SLATT domain-containing protein [Bryobacteraceae bacterium]|nr:SLATT domain-containing protein [Bryobacteraceae bacterium]
MAPPPSELLNLSWNEEDLESSLATLRRYVENEAQRQIEWYRSKRQRKASVSTALRFSAILLFVLGGLVPVVKATLTPEAVSHLGFDFGQVGYLLIAIAAGCVAMDRFFGYSTGWIRYMTTGLALEKSLEEFRLEWARHMAKLRGEAPREAELDQLILTCESFILAVRAQVEQETHAWVAEFESNLAQLERDLAARADDLKRQKSGS